MWTIQWSWSPFRDDESGSLYISIFLCVSTARVIYTFTVHTWYLSLNIKWVGRLDEYIALILLCFGINFHSLRQRPPLSSQKKQSQIGFLSFVLGLGRWMSKTSKSNIQKFHYKILQKRSDCIAYKSTFHARKKCRSCACAKVESIKWHTVIIIFPIHQLKIRQTEW